MRPAFGAAGRTGFLLFSGFGMDECDGYKDYYAVLGVPPTADRRVIARAYRRLIKSVHPDSHTGLADAEAGRRVAELVDAWRVLGDPARRAAYDKARAARRAGSAGGHECERSTSELPLLRIEPVSLDLGIVRRGETAQGRVRIDNLGGPATSIEESCSTVSWVSVSPAEPVDAGFSFPIWLSVRVDTTGLAQWRRHNAEVALRLANRENGLRSAEQRLAVTLFVAPAQPPRLRVRPGSLLVDRRECEGAPHSLMLHLSLENAGGGAVSGCIRSSPWIRAIPQRFGPIPQNAQPLPVVAEIDCHAWERAGWQDGAIWFDAGAGGLKWVRLISGVSAPSSAGWAGVSWPIWRAVVAFVAAAGPLVTLLLGLPLFLAAAAVVAAAALPSLSGHATRWELATQGSLLEADGCDRGLSFRSERTWFLGLLWAALGGALWQSSPGGSGWPWSGPSAGWVGGAAGLMCGAGLVLEGGFQHGFATGCSGLLGRLVRVAFATAWAIILARVSLSLFGASLAQASLWGAALGWAMGNLVVWAGSQELPFSWRRSAANVLDFLVPIVAGCAGLAAARILTVQLLPHAVAGFAQPPLAPSTSRTVLALHALPGSSLLSSAAAILACAGLVGGFCLGLASVLPAGWVDWPRWTALARGAFLRSIWDAVIELVSGYLVGWEAGGLPKQWNGQLLSTCRSDRLMAVLFVGAVALFLLLYATGQLLLGVVLALGMAAG